MNKDDLLAQAVQEYQAARVAAMEKAVRKPKPEPKVLSLPTPEVRERPGILPPTRRWGKFHRTITACLRIFVCKGMKSSSAISLNWR